MTEREKHIEMAQRLGLVGMRPHLDGIYIDALAAFARLVADDARATPALLEAFREKCAVLCETECGQNDGISCAEAIRAMEIEL